MKNWLLAEFGADVFAIATVGKINNLDDLFHFNPYGLNPWDVAAGSLLIQEAGGKVTDFEGEEMYLESGNIAAGNPFVHGKILEVTKRRFNT